jgi:hypothetical protein
MTPTETFLALGLTLAGISGIVGALSVWCRPVKYTQLGRFAGNDVALRSYENRLAAAGIGKVRNVREVV